MKRLSNSENVDNTYLNARKRLEDLKAFYQCLLSYCLVIPFLIFVNYYTFWGFKWFWFPLLGWGIGLGFQAYQVYVQNGIFGRKWEEQKIQEFMLKEENRFRN